MEDLSVRNMQKNPQLAKAISEVNWSQLAQRFECKARWYGKQIIRVGKTIPPASSVLIAAINIKT